MGVTQYLSGWAVSRTRSQAEAEVAGPRLEGPALQVPERHRPVTVAEGLGE
jgi:hypothetical protein